MTGLTDAAFSVMEIFPLVPDERLEFHLKLCFPVSVTVTELLCALKGVVRRVRADVWMP